MGLAEQVEQLNEENAALRVEVGELRAENGELRAKLEALEAELEKLKREMGRNSSNSGKPPSSDTLGERAKQAEERLSRARAAAPGPGMGQEVLERTGRAPSWQAARRGRGSAGESRQPRPHSRALAGELRPLRAKPGSGKGGRH